MDKLKAFWESAAKVPFLALGVILVLVGAIGLLPIGSATYPIPPLWRWILLLVGLAFAIIDAVRYLRDRGKPRQSLASVTGGINRPANNDRISRAFGAAGWARDVEKNQHLWLIIEVADHKWPKGDEIRPDKNGAWQSDVFEDGTGGAVSLALYVADEEGHKKIRAWLDIGALTGYHPFERDVPGTRRLARVDDLHR